MNVFYLSASPPVGDFALPAIIFQAEAFLALDETMNTKLAALEAKWADPEATARRQNAAAAWRFRRKKNPRKPK